jgi:hypothetical protein
LEEWVSSQIAHKTMSVQADRKDRIVRLSNGVPDLLCRWKS